MNGRKQHCVAILILCLLCFHVPDARAQIPELKQKASPITIDGVKRLIQDRKGKVLFLNLWATWCAPCVQEFPDIATLRTLYSDSIVDIVGISVDYPDERESKVLPFLDSLRITFTVYIADVHRQDDLINAIEPAWSGAVPATFIYDRHSARRSFLLGQKDLKIFKVRVDSALTVR